MACRTRVGFARVCSAATGNAWPCASVLLLALSTKGLHGFDRRVGSRRVLVGGEWAVSAAVRGAVPEPSADRILCRPSPACSSSCHSALGDALCLLVRKAPLRRASASLGRLSQPSGLHSRGLPGGPTPTSIPGNMRGTTFFSASPGCTQEPSACLLLPVAPPAPTSCPPHPLASDRTGSPATQQPWILLPLLLPPSQV